MPEWFAETKKLGVALKFFVPQEVAGILALFDAISAEG